MQNFIQFQAWAKINVNFLYRVRAPFKTVVLLVPEKRFEIDFQDGGCGSRLGILIGII